MIRLTTDDGTTVYVNPDKIEVIEPLGDGCVIVFCHPGETPEGRRFIMVQEDPENVLSRIKHPE